MLAAVSSNSGLEYEFNAWPILTLCTYAGAGMRSCLYHVAMTRLAVQYAQYAI